MEDYSRNEERHDQNNASFVLGILSIVFVVVCQLVGLILGIIGIHKARGRNDSGWVLSVIGVVLNAVVIAAVFILIIVGVFIFAEVFEQVYYW